MVVSLSEQNLNSIFGGTMRKTKMFEGKRHVYDTEKAEALGTRSFG